MVLAHAGGVPEAATIVLPLLVVGAFVFQERRNVRRLREQEAADRSTDPASPDPASADPASADPAPVDPAPVDPAPVDPAPVDPGQP